MNTIQFCLAVYNKANGFYSNHHLNGNYWYNNTGYRNGTNFNMVNRESPLSDNINVNGYDHVLINNLSYKPRSSNTSYIDNALNTLETNSFELNTTITDLDFVSLDESELTAERKPDGSLPGIDFLKLHPTSNLIDIGTDIGFPFYSIAPDLGAFEQDSVVSVGTNNPELYTFNVYPNPVENILYIQMENIRKVKVMDLTGKVWKDEAGVNKINVQNLPKGMYILWISDHQNNVFSRIIVKK